MLKLVLLLCVLSLAVAMPQLNWDFNTGLNLPGGFGANVNAGASYNNHPWGPYGNVGAGANVNTPFGNVGGSTGFYLPGRR